MSKTETTSSRTPSSLSGPSTAPQMAPPDIQAFNPPLAWYTDNILFEDNWKRASLAARDRSIVTLSTLIACGHTAQMVGHLGRGLTNGLKPTEIVEIIAHLAFYCGWPCAMSATNVMKQVFTDRGITPEQLASGAGALAEIKGQPAEVPSAAMRAVTPDLAEFTDSVVSGDLWLRPHSHLGTAAL